MTKKQELLDYCELNLDNTTNMLQIETIMNNDTPCFMSVGASKARTIEIITNNFDDELLGSMPNDSTVHQIQTWNVIPR